MNDVPRRLLVLNAMDWLGHRVVELLLRHRSLQVTATNLNPIDLIDLAARGARLRKINVENRDSLNAGLAGAERMLIISSTLTGTLKSRQQQFDLIIRSAVNAGVQTIVFGLVSDSTSAEFSDFIERSEVQQTCELQGVQFAFFEVGWYFETLFTRVSLSLRIGKWLTSAADGRLAYISREDAARFFAATLCMDSIPAGNCITGSTAIAPGQLVNAVNSVFGSNIILTPVPEREFSDHLRDSGVPMLSIEQALTMERASLGNKGILVDDTVAKVTGRASWSLIEILAKNRMDILLRSAPGCSQ